MLFAPTPSPSVGTDVLHVALVSGSSNAAIWTALGSATVGVCAVAAAIISSRRTAKSVTSAKHLEYKQGALLAFLDATFELTRCAHRELWTRANRRDDTERVARHAQAARDARVEFRRAQVGARVWGDPEIAGLGDEIWDLYHDATKAILAVEPDSPECHEALATFDAAVKRKQSIMVQYVQFGLGVTDAFG